MFMHLLRYQNNVSPKTIGQVDTPGGGIKYILVFHVPSGVHSYQTICLTQSAPLPNYKIHPQSKFLRDVCVLFCPQALTVGG